MNVRRIVTTLTVVGILVALPVAAGDIQTDGQFVSTVASGTPPLMVTSDTVVPGLNADLLDGFHAGDIVAQSQDETRTEIDSVPFTISAPGSYYLSANQTMTVATSAITVNADHVTIDLGGFVLDGDGIGTVGIFMNGRTGVTIRNGVIRNFANEGVEEFSGTGAGHRVLDLRLEGNSGSGISLGGDGHLVSRCLALGNGTSTLHSGIIVFGSVLVVDSIVQANLGDGLSVGKGSTVVRSLAIANAREGFLVIDGTISESTAHSNARSGINCRGSRVVNNSVHGNNTGATSQQGGIRASQDCYVADNIAIGNAIANFMITSDDNVIVGNLANDGPDDGISFLVGGNFWADNRASGNSTNFGGTVGQTDGGGNTAF